MSKRWKRREAVSAMFLRVVCFSKCCVHRYSFCENEKSFEMLTYDLAF